jgi:hypothetical protein
VDKWDMTLAQTADGVSQLSSSRVADDEDEQLERYVSLSSTHPCVGY